jgi:hypothetical protein
MAKLRIKNTQTGPQDDLLLNGQYGIGYFTPELAALQYNRFDALSNPEQYWYSWDYKLIHMRRDPTLALLRQLWISPILSAGWSVEADDDVADEVIAYAEEEMERIHGDIIPTAGLGCLDWGWAPFEIVYYMRPDGQLGIKYLKSLLQVMTIIETDERTGEYIGLSQQDVFIDPLHALLFNFDVIGTNWYGQAPMKAAELPYDSTVKVDASKFKLNQRIAGEHWVIYYPVGTTEQNGQEVDNFDVANSIMEKMLADGSCTLPNEIRSELNILNGDAGTSDYQSWRIELLSAGDTSSTFYTDQNKYNDTLKARALGFPERSVFEGQYGTKAEAATHKDIAIAGLEKRAAELTTTVSRQLLKPMIEFGWGPEVAEKVKLIANPIQDSKLSLWLKLYEKFLTNPDVLIEEFDSVNMREVREKLGIPQYDEDQQNPDPLREQIDERAPDIDREEGNPDEEETEEPDVE